MFPPDIKLSDQLVHNCIVIVHSIIWIYSGKQGQLLKDGCVQI